jgi:hypothetical protein
MLMTIKLCILSHILSHYSVNMIRLCTVIYHMINVTFKCYYYYFGINHQQYCKNNTIPRICKLSIVKGTQLMR